MEYLVNVLFSKLNVLNLVILPEFAGLAWVVPVTLSSRYILSISA